MLFWPMRWVSQVVQRLDGIPLALELAAPRLKVLKPEALLKRLDDQLRLLTGGTRKGVPRQQTLRAAIEWSYACSPRLSRRCCAD